jgi:dTDP-4-amino-4,6-dideoxygalactose transaminase
VESLAIHGGKPVKTTPFGTGKRFGEPEIQQLREAVEQNTLFYWHGQKVKAFTQKFADMHGMKHCVATSSGTAAIHVALGACGVTEGDEVITTPVTDMGTVIGILFQNAIPIFADMNPHTYGMDPKSFEARITDKTKAVLVVHLTGNPTEMDPILAVAKKHNLFVIEDCAQAYMCRYKGQLAGTFGHFGCFSTNDYKHISTGDGGMVVTNDDELYRTAFRFADKNYDRFAKTPSEMRAAAYIAPCYRMSELQGAVGLAQLDRLEGICAARTKYGDAITQGISGLKGIYPHRVEDGNTCSYWFYMMRVFEDEAGVNAADFSKALAAEGIPNGLGYTDVLYKNEMFAKKSAYIGTNAPFDSKYYGREIEYKPGLCPVAEDIHRTAIRLGVSEFYTEQDITDIIASVRKVAAHYGAAK